MARILILGYGNALRCDDGLGWKVAVELFRANRSPDIEVLPCHQLTPELAEPVSAAELVLFIDCARDGQPGDFHYDEIQLESAAHSFTHHLTPGTLLDLSSELFGACPKAYLLTICGLTFEPGECLSNAVSQKVGELKSKVRLLIEDCLTTSACVS